MQAASGCCQGHCQLLCQNDADFQNPLANIEHEQLPNGQYKELTIKHTY